MSKAVSAPSGGAATLGQRPPRLVLRVVLFSALTLGIGAATLLVYIRHFERGRAEHTATLQASIVAQAVVDQLHPSDLRVPLSAARRDELDRLFTARVLDEETLASAVAAPDGRLVYATDAERAGTRVSSQASLAEALGGTVTSELISTEVGATSKRILRAYAPFRLSDGSSGVLVVDKDYGPIASAARRAAITVATVLELVLLSLWLCLFPIMRSVTRRMNRQLDTIAHQALHDDLTGLANRTQFGSRLDDALASEDGEDVDLAVFFIDLERFKEVNDALGHHCGNDLLTVIAKRLDYVLGPEELVARLGGDEFGVLSERAVDERSALALAGRLQDAIGQPCEIAGVSLEVQGSIGIALAPAHGTSRDELLRRADIAMYAAKRLGAPQVFSPGLDDSSPLRLAMTGELRRAIERFELVVHYQPQVDLRHGVVRGAEALVRWRHPTRGFLGPEAFLAAAEQGGLMRNLTRYVLDQSLQQVRSWRNAGLELDLAINVSGRDLADARFPDEIAHALAEHGVDPSWLELEITESVLLSDRVRASRMLERLVDQGVRIAIDDFGVGYSSLGQLKNLPAHVLKIDRSFVSSMDSDRSDEAIVNSTIELAHRLGLKVIAEGVETAEHLSRLRAAGCDIGQGHLLGRPIPGQDIVPSARALHSAWEPEPASSATVVPLRRVAG
ncbi:MAG: Diguanylate cyclase protein [Thermoleophilia bacterium]|nr:Diguanylate cyclase protein [Thermoleophilia bacterium]